MNDLFASASHTPGVHIGIGGWTYVPWRGGMFYPVGLVQRRELEFASQQLTSIEINGTYYGAQKPHIYAGWRDATPEGFVFSAKAPKRIVSARKLAATGGQIDDFIEGISHLGNRLGPLVWQFEAGRTLDRDDLAAFLQLLPQQVNGRRQRHAVEVRDPGCFDAELVALIRQHRIALVYTDSADYPNAADLSGDFVYARLMGSRDEHSTGYPAQELSQWAGRIRSWRKGDDVAELPHLATPLAPAAPREVFLYFISAAKHRNPSAARELQRLIDAN
ncbi:DUF72 domain-containing protein [Stenotrophomonas pigmentata]|uniref:DUF72 domain-containing protein n=1 Tax=Stenotrophomonas pigmentata TaxID=3055080 RepID=UPI0026F081A0|nr:DUF72 domain-containing protein [Stenotrophomonas sp. 610A2]